jgi:two-component sensor histidine kinase
MNDFRSQLFFVLIFATTVPVLTIGVYQAAGHYQKTLHEASEETAKEALRLADDVQTKLAIIHHLGMSLGSSGDCQRVLKSDLFLTRAESAVARFVDDQELLSGAYIYHLAPPKLLGSAPSYLEVLPITELILQSLKGITGKPILQSKSLLISSDDEAMRLFFKEFAVLINKAQDGKAALKRLNSPSETDVTSTQHLLLDENIQHLLWLFPIPGLMGKVQGAVITVLPLELVGRFAQAKALKGQVVVSRSPPELQKDDTFTGSGKIALPGTLAPGSLWLTVREAKAPYLKEIWANTLTIGLWVLLLSLVFALGGYALARALFAKHGRLIQEQEKAKQELKRAGLESELLAMRQQMNPHFLFNALNSVATLVTVDPKKSVPLITSLANIYRTLITSARQKTVPLREEIALIEEYLQVEKVRYGERLKFSLDIEDDTIHIPGLIIQNLVENAVKHGVAKSRNPTEIAVRVAREGDMVKIAVTNDLNTSAKDVKGSTGPIGTHTGLVNTQKRLTLLYGERHRFQMKKSGGKVMVEFYVTGQAIA